MADSRTECRDDLIRSVTRQKTSFNLSRFIQQHGYAPDDVATVAEETLHDMHVKFAEKGVITHQEQRKLKRLSAVLEISPDQLKTIELAAFESAVGKEIEKAESDGVVTQAELGKLQMLSEMLDVQLPSEYQDALDFQTDVPLDDELDDLESVSGSSAADVGQPKTSRKRSSSKRSADNTSIAIIGGTCLLVAGLSFGIFHSIGLPSPPIRTMVGTGRHATLIAAIQAILVAYLGCRIAHVILAKQSDRRTLAFNLNFYSVDMAVVLVVLAFWLQSLMTGGVFVVCYLGFGAFAIAIARWFRQHSETVIPIFAFIGAWELIGLLRILYGLSYGMTRFGMLQSMLVIGPFILLFLGLTDGKWLENHGGWSGGSCSGSSCGSSCGGGGCGGGCGGCGG
jgi:hypothetical protein